MQITFQNQTKRKHVDLILIGHICVHTNHSGASIALDARKLGYDVSASLPACTLVQTLREGLSRPCM